MKIKAFNKYYTLGILIIFPYLVMALMSLDEPRGMIYLLLHQFYYLPLSWLGEPFYKLNADISYSVLVAGRVTSAIFYFIMWLVVVKFINRAKANKALNSQPSAAGTPKSGAH